MKECMQCGMELDDSAQTCPKCGAFQNSVKKSIPETVENASIVEDPPASTQSTSVVTQKSNVGKIVVIVLISISVLLGGLYGYGYWKASDQLNKGQLSLMSAGFTIQAMNPISAEGYRNFIMNKTDMPQRLKDLDNTD